MNALLILTTYCGHIELLHDLMAVTGIRSPLVGLFMIDITGIHVTKKNMTKW